MLSNEFCTPHLPNIPCRTSSELPKIVLNVVALACLTTTCFTLSAGDVVDLKILSHPKKSGTEITNKATRPTPLFDSTLSSAAPPVTSTAANRGPAPQVVHPYSQTPHGSTPHTVTQPAQPLLNQTQQKQSQPLSLSQPQQKTPKQQLQFPQTGHGETPVGYGAGTEVGQIRRKPRTSVGETLAHGSHHHTLPRLVWPGYSLMSVLPPLFFSFLSF